MYRVLATNAKLFSVRLLRSVISWVELRLMSLVTGRCSNRLHTPGNTSVLPIAC